MWHGSRSSSKRDLLVGFFGNEGRETGNGAGCSAVEVDPAPLVVEARSVVASARPLRPDPVSDAVVQRPAAPACTQYVTVTSSLRPSPVSGATRRSWRHVMTSWVNGIKLLSATALSNCAPLRQDFLLILHLEHESADVAFSYSTLNATMPSGSNNFSRERKRNMRR